VTAVPEPAPRARGPIQSVDRALDLLHAIVRSSRPIMLADLAAETGLGRSTAWRLLATMEGRGLIDRDGPSGGYVIGPGALVIAAGTGERSILQRARPALDRLARDTGETASLAMPRRFGLFYIDQVDPPTRVAANWRGIELALHATSSGKAFLAHLPSAERESLLAQPLHRYTESTITDRRSLAAELDATIRRGYATCSGELEDREFGVSSAVVDMHGRPLAAVGLWGPVERLPSGRFDELGARVALVAAEVGAAISLGIA
jgi:DNA-binding IclR family transcriptional regulator